MKKILLMIGALLAFGTAELTAQSFLNKLQQAMGGNTENTRNMNVQAQGDDDPNAIASGEQALPPKRSSTFGWDGVVTPSSAKFPIPLMNEFPTVPSASELINPVEANQIKYYKAIKAVTLRAEELNQSNTCEDQETLLWRKNSNKALKEAYGLTDEELALIEKGNMTEAEQQRISEKIAKAALGGLNPDDLEKQAADLENMSEDQIMARTIESTCAVYDKNAAGIRKYMGVSAEDMKKAARAQAKNTKNPDQMCPEMKAIYSKAEAYQKVEAAKNPSFKNEAKAFEQKIKKETQEAAMNSMNMGGLMGAMSNMQRSMSPILEMQQKLTNYVQQVQKLMEIPDAEADAKFAASERKKVLEIKKKIYETNNAAVYNPLYWEALEMIMSYRERAAKAWVNTIQKQFNTLKNNLPELIKLNRQAIEDGIIPECALWREPFNLVIDAGDLLANAYSEFPSDYPKMYKEEIYGYVDLLSMGNEGNRHVDDNGYHHGLSPWWPEFCVYSPAYFDAILAGEYFFAMDGNGQVYKHKGGVTKGSGGAIATGSWEPVSNEEFKKLNSQKSEASPASTSWTSQDGKRTVYYNAEGGFIQLPEGDQVFPVSWKKDGNAILWIHLATEDTGDGNFKYQIVLCSYKL